MGWLRWRFRASGVYGRLSERFLTLGALDFRNYATVDGCRSSLTLSFFQAGFFCRKELMSNVHTNQHAARARFQRKARKRHPV